ncbi:MAG TPA: phage holin family protein [Albidovulum sp.]|uniref:phage holin family protein n=1 Tax=Albidovulum sp. TaxID=1872424 RepID=UPI002CDD0AAF|nr:phage holin family protein [Albidovulum sp.]
MADEGGRPSVATLVSDALGHLIAILRGEIALAKAEMRDTAAKAGSALALMAVAAVLGVVGLNMLAGTAVLALIAMGLSEVVAALVVGVAILGVAAILFFMARDRLQAASKAPGRVKENLKRSAAAVKGVSSDV